MTDTPQPAPFDPGGSSAGTPILWHQGQPISREAAAVKLAEFDANADRVKAALGGDIAAQQERRDYWMLSRGHQPGAVPTMPSDAAGVQQQMNEREIQITEARLDTWAKHIRMNDEMYFEAARGLATQDQVDDARREVARMIADKSFGARVLAGEMDAKDRWARFNLIASMKVAPADYDWSKDQAP